jgi:hypothetical protein
MWHQRINIGTPALVHNQKLFVKRGTQEKRVTFVRNKEKCKSGTRQGADTSLSNEALPTLGLASGTNSVVADGSGVVVVGGPAEQKIV